MVLWGIVIVHLYRSTLRYLIPLNHYWTESSLSKLAKMKQRDSGGRWAERSKVSLCDRTEKSLTGRDARLLRIRFSTACQIITYWSLLNYANLVCQSVFILPNQLLLFQAISQILLLFHSCTCSLSLSFNLCLYLSVCLSVCLCV